MENCGWLARCFYRPEQVAKWLRVSGEYVRQAIEKGDLEAQRFGRTYRIGRTALIRWLMVTRYTPPEGEGRGEGVEEAGPDRRRLARPCDWQKEVEDVPLGIGCPYLSRPRPDRKRKAPKR